MSTTGHEHELVEVQGLKASMKKGGNIGIYNDVVCSTAGATAAKVTNTVPPSFSLTNKAKILVKFTYGINVANATLQVGENAAKPIFYQGSALDAGRVKAGMFVLMQYDGTNFNIIGDIAKMDEYYKDLHAGLADNLFGETQTNDKFIFRPTAGIQDIESGEPPVGGGAIRKVEGNAVAWNQLVDGLNSQAISQYISYSNGIFTINKTNDSNVWADYLFGKFLPNSTHKYYIGCIYLGGTVSGNVCISDGFSMNFNLQVSSSSQIIIPHTKTDMGFGLSIPANATADNYKFKLNIIDLTLLFGSGNEPTTVDAFESWLSQNIGLKSYYPYNAGELIPVKDYKVKSVGFNAFDGVWIGANIDVDGSIVASSSHALTSPIKVLPNTNYYFNTTIRNVNAYFASWDDGGNYLGVFKILQSFPSSFTTPVNASIMRIQINGAYSTIHDYDFNINLSYDDDKDGTYEPYEEHQVNIDVTKVYGKLNGSGDYVQVFPEGIRAAGTAKDVLDLKNGIATVNVGNVDLGTLTWLYDNGDTATANQPYFNSKTGVSNAKNNTTNQIVANYIRNLTVGRDAIPDKAFSYQNSTTSKVVVRDSAHNASDINNSHAAFLEGVIMHYELETPLTYTDLVYRNNGVDIPVSEVSYAVDDYGTEEVLLGNDEEIVSVAPTMTIKYGINAADTIADLPHDYVSCKPQSLVDSEQRTARNNIGAASTIDVMKLQKEIDVISKKTESDYWVDMGLPSGVLWAKRNIDVTQSDGFAASEYQYECSFFSWGNTEGHNPTSTSAFSYNWGSSNDGPYASTDGAKLTGNIPLSQDAARENCGEPWRMPSTEEFKELFDNCDFLDANGDIIASTTTNKLITMSGTIGIHLKSKINGNRIFFPCSGYGDGTSWNFRGSIGLYWSGSLYSAAHGRGLVFYNMGVHPQNDDNRYGGFAVRPVM